MKKIALLLFFISNFSYASLVSFKEFEKLPVDLKTETLKIYIDFLKAYSEVTETSDAKTYTLIELISSAYANGNYNCFYAGWPSVKRTIGSRNICTSPANGNSSYPAQSASCGSNSLLCQPMLFGNNLCVSTSTQAQRNRAFASCEKKFRASGRSLASVATSLAQPANAQSADELFSTVDRVCSTGFQSGNGMCRNLIQKVAAIRAQNVLRSPARLLVPVSQIEVVSANQVVVDPVIRESMISAVQGIPNAETATSTMQPERCDTCQAAQTGEANSLPIVDPEVVVQDPEPSGPVMIPFPRINSGFGTLCSSSQGRGNYQETFVFDCTARERVDMPDGFRFNNGPGHPYLSNARSGYSDGSTPTRNIIVSSENHALNETFLILEDAAGGPDSHDVKSMMFLLPRKTVPQVRVQGEEIHLTLSTGEQVVMDKNSRAIRQGALREGPIDLNTNRFARTPPNVHYSGTGISIRLDHRFEYPTIGAATAQVKQGSRTCNIPRAQLFNAQGKLTTSSDAELLRVINQRCGAGFSI